MAQLGQSTTGFVGGTTTTVSKLFESGVTESSDNSKFGGLVFEGPGLLQRTVLWNSGGLVISKAVGERPYGATLIQQRLKAHATATSVGRIRFPSRGGQALLSGWVSGKGNDRFFISSSHGFPPDGSVTRGYVTFAALWDGEEPYPGDDIVILEVDLVDSLAAAEILVWKFKAADHNNVPAPLSFARKLQGRDEVFGAGYCVVPTQEKLTEYFNSLADPVKAKAYLPDVGAATLAYHPNHKVVAPGPVVAADTRRNLSMFGVQASMYHGMSGGPIILLDAAAAVLGVTGQVIGNTETIQMNCNTVLDLHDGAVHPFLSIYM